MLFADLMSLPHDRAGNIDLQAILAALPGTPHEVAKQLYADHGRKGEHQAVYGRIDISSIIWQRVARPASALIAADHLGHFTPWLESVGRRANHFSSKGWRCIDSRSDVIAHWSQHETWITPPVLVIGALVGSRDELYLMEGHTRAGLLSGLVRNGIVSPDSMHYVWLGA